MYFCADAICGIKRLGDSRLNWRREPLMADTNDIFAVVRKRNEQYSSTSASFDTSVKESSFTGGSSELVLRAAGSKANENHLFHCDVCGAGFTQSGNMRRHRTIHDGTSQGLACPVCGVKLSRQDSLMRHMRKNHNMNFAD